MSASPHASLLRPASVLGVALALAACGTEPGAAVVGPGASAPAVASSAAAAMAKLAKNLTGAQVRALLGPPAAIKEIKAAGVTGEAWSYPFRGTPEIRVVPVTTQDLPATNPVTGQAIHRTESVYQNQEVEMVDTLHLLMVGDRLIEWSTVRTEQKRFQ